MTKASNIKEFITKEGNVKIALSSHRHLEQDIEAELFLNSL